MRKTASVLGLALAVWLTPPLAADSPGRVILLSLDGMGTQLFREDPLAAELRALRALEARGTMAESLIPAMPSTTANSHAALWTGAWGDVNGITSNDMPLGPRRDSWATRRVQGFRSDGLRAEPIWVTAARQGVRTVAQQATQVYPLTPLSTGDAIVVHGYQTDRVAPGRWLTAGDVHSEACTAPSLTAVCFAWDAGPITFHAVLENGSRVRVRAGDTPREVTATLAPAEHASPRGRELARHFSDGLLIDQPGVAPVVAYFRLFEASADGRTLLLYQSGLRDTALTGPGPVSRADKIRFLEAAGGFIGNGDHEPWEAPGRSGTPLALGGDGTRERRYLETVELGIRQTIRQAGYLWRMHEPRFLVAYSSIPDEIDHTWLGQAREDARFNEFRRWGYEVVDRLVETYVSLVGPDDHLVITSDHGMTPITHEVRLNRALLDAGLVAATSAGAVEPQRSQVLLGRNCIQIHTDDWRDGVVPVASRDAVMDRAEAALRAVRDPDGRPVLTAFLRTQEERERFGFGGENGYDACFDVLPGYVVSTTLEPGPLTRVRRRATGEHGFLPTRADMRGILVAVGPRIANGGRWPVQRSIDVAPLVSDLLGIDPPRDARGRSPLQQ